MRNPFPSINFPLVAALLLFMIGIYQFMNFRDENHNWMYLMLGALLNAYLAVKQRENHRNK